MKKVILCAVLLAYTALGHAQENSSSTQRSEWLPTFTSVVVSAGVDIRFVQVSDNEAPRIVYDTKGSYTTKFRAEVKNQALTIAERIDTRRPERTTVTLYFNNLSSLSLTDAVASFASPLHQNEFSLIIGARSTLNMALDVKDLAVELTGKSEATLSGKARYLSLFASTGKVNAEALETMSAMVSASSSAAVTIWATDRFEGKTSTGATIRYKGEPQIIRTAAKLMGGTVTPIK